MQRLIELLKQTPTRSEPERWNLCREYLQLSILRSIYQSPFGTSLVFQGGTCLRFCHHLKRYSEDLDFSLVKETTGYSFSKLHAGILRDLTRRGFDVSGPCSESKVVQKAFVRIGGVPNQVRGSLPITQKLAIKLEVDVRPPAHGVQETFFVSRMNELFPILKYDLPTLFAGKTLAVLFRPYERGRDYYDLLWFLSQHTTGNMRYFQSGLAQVAAKKRAQFPARGWTDVLSALAARVQHIVPARLAKDLRPFLEDPADLTWIQQYPRVFQQLIQEQR